MSDSNVEKVAPESQPSDGVEILENVNEGASKDFEKSLLRKIDGQLLPAVGILYLLSFLDRSNGLLALSTSRLRLR